MTPRFSMRTLLVVGLFACLLGFVGGKILREFQTWTRPVVYEDVTSEQLRHFGLPFGRPDATRRSIVAAVGNGLRDTVAYAAIELSPEEADTLFATLKADPLSSACDGIQVAHYLDQLSPDQAQRLWPGGFKPGEVIEYKGSYVAHQQGSGWIHASEWGG
jgi:hypothetical protein